MSLIIILILSIIILLLVIVITYILKNTLYLRKSDKKFLLFIVEFLEKNIDNHDNILEEEAKNILLNGLKQLKKDVK